MNKTNRLTNVTAADPQASSQDICEVRSIDLTGDWDAHLGIAYRAEHGPVYSVRGKAKETDEA